MTFFESNFEYFSNAVVILIVTFPYCHALVMSEICFDLIFELIIYIIFVIIVAIIVDTTGMSEDSATFSCILVIVIFLLLGSKASKLGKRVNLDKDGDGEISDKEWADLDGDGKLSVDETDLLTQQNSKEAIEPLVTESQTNDEWWIDDEK